MKTKIILIAIISIGIYIYLNSVLNEKFITSDAYLDNPIRDSLNRSAQTLDSINIIKPINMDAIYDQTLQKINEEDALKDKQYSDKESIQSKDIINLKNQVSSLMNENIMLIPETVLKVKSIKSVQNSQPLNVNQLENGKYMINVNGQCLKSNGLNRTSVKSCNQDDPSQYFELNVIYNKDDYKNNVGDSLLINNPTFKYPFSIMKSTTNGNCLTNKDSVLSMRPCEPNISQQWKNSNDPIVCTYESV